MRRHVVTCAAGHTPPAPGLEPPRTPAIDLYIDRYYRELWGQLPEKLRQEYEEVCGRLDAGAGQEEDLDAYRPASEFLDGDLCATYKRLHAILNKHPWVRRLKPGKSRFLVHAGDWHRLLAAVRAKGFAALDQDPEIIAAFVAEAQARQQQTARRKARRKAR
jgi:hypothetical protein